MKLVLGVAVLVLLTVTASCEDCTLNTDCVTTTCSQGYNVICEHPEDAGVETGGGKCTCATGEACTLREDCYSPAHPELECDDSQRHCYDNGCICTRFPGFPGGL